MKVPGFANKGVYLVTSLTYSHTIPSPRVGSGVEVRQTISQIKMSFRERKAKFTFYILESKNPKSIKLCPVGGHCKVKSYGGP